MALLDLKSSLLLMFQERRIGIMGEGIVNDFGCIVVVILSLVITVIGNRLQVNDLSRIL